MKTSGIIGTVLGVFVVLPIWFFILYTILEALEVDRLVWFLYWIYVPADILTTILIKIGLKED